MYILFSVPRVAANLTWMAGPRVLHWHGAISSGRGHLSAEAASLPPKRSKRAAATEKILLILYKYGQKG